MRVLILSQMYPSPANPINGIFVHEQAKALARHGCEVKIICPIPWVPPMGGLIKDEWKLYNQTPNMTYRDGMQVFYPRYLILPNNIGLEFHGWSYCWAIRGIATMLQQQWPFDVIHAHVALPDGHGAMLLGRRSGIPVVLTIHGQDVYYTINRNELSRKRVVEVLNETDALISVSSSLTRQINQYINDKHKVVTILNGVAMEHISTAPEQLKQRYAGEKVILSVANIIKTKGHELVLEALKKIVKRHPDVVYVIVGDGEYRTSLEARVKELGMEEYVEFIGQLPHEEAMKYMSVCDMFVLPSWQEGFGIAYTEAMVHGKPVIACRNTGIADIIVNGKNGLLVEPMDVHSLAEAMFKFLDEPDYARIIGDNGRSAVIHDLTWDNNAERVIEVYEKLKGIKHGGEKSAD